MHFYCIRSGKLLERQELIFEQPTQLIVLLQYKEIKFNLKLNSRAVSKIRSLLLSNNHIYLVNQITFQGADYDSKLICGDYPHLVIQDATRWRYT